ncbi:DUF2752 domain-containing protein [Sphingobacterium luzhongxinii]|uniref:DUF2752 domain-containing protein n=2 Tax=Sphingobacterium TaxID=28453 RepID=UPI00293BEBB4|nr:DUF2752 domain-containing protein [Sphingobacterium sp. xlx-73]
MATYDRNFWFRTFCIYSFLMTIKRSHFFILYPVIIGGIGLIYKYFNPLESVFFPRCPTKTITGLDCPGCGMQRAAHHLLNGEIQLAFIQNPLLFALTPYILLGFYLQLVPQPTETEFKLRRVLYSQKAIIILGVITLIYTIIRNIHVV